MESTAAGATRISNDDGQQQPTQTQSPTSRYKFSQDELRVLKECNRESFYFRCLPFGTVLGSLTYLAVKKGYLTTSTRFGPTPKVLFACTFGYFIGKFSYQQKCIEKLMQLPNSVLGEELRKQRGKSLAGGGGEDLTSYGGLHYGSGLGSIESTTTTTTSSATSNNSTSDYPAPPTPLNLSIDQSSATQSMGTDLEQQQQFYTAEDSNRQKSAADNYDEDEELLSSNKSQPKMLTKSYDELRKQNRIDYYEKQQVGRQQQQQALPRPQQGSSSGENTRQQQENSKLKNQYGDIWEK